MFKIRERANTTPRQQRQLFEIAANHDRLPLNEENWAERWCTFAADMDKIYERLFNFEVRDDDVFVLGFMKSGTTWTNETVWQIMKGLDFNYTKKKNNELCRHCLEYNAVFLGQADMLTVCDKLPGPRLLQSHLPVNLLPKQFWDKKPKSIYVARNVKDVVVSAFTYIQWLGLWHGTMDEFVQDFMKEDIWYTPYWAHIVDFWKLRHEPYILFITYEEMKRDLAGVIKKMCVFLEKPSLNETELNALVNHLSFERMTDNKMANPTTRLKRLLPKKSDANAQFMRRGIVGSYKDELSVDNQNLLNEWSRNFLAKHDIKEEDIFGNI